MEEAMSESWQLGAAGVCILVKLLLTGKDTLNDCFCESVNKSL